MQDGLTEIIGIVEELLIVGANIQNHGQNSTRMKASGSHIQIQFSDGNAQSTQTQIAQPQNPEIILR